jgi:wyosine [tRNA(Phe)-imidazoG37] synthetase (radical SAM superfamily)
MRVSSATSVNASGRRGSARFGIIAKPPGIGYGLSNPGEFAQTNPLGQAKTQEQKPNNKTRQQPQCEASRVWLYPLPAERAHGWRQEKVIIWQETSGPILACCHDIRMTLVRQGIQNRRITNGFAWNGNGHAQAGPPITDEVAYAYPRDYLENQFVYLVISPRARGLSIGVNVNPIVNCTFQCIYCEVSREKPPTAPHFSIEKVAEELHRTLVLASSGALRQRPRYAKLPSDLLQVRHVAISGDGEPTLSSHFLDALLTIVHRRGMGDLPPFKIVVLTNSTTLDRPEVQHGLDFLKQTDEIWAKLDGGTQDYLNRINGGTFPLEKIMANILLVARQRPVVIQSMFPAINGEPPSAHEIEQYALRLKTLKKAGAQISLVQIYSAIRPMARTGCSHLPLKELSRIAKTVRQIARLRTEVF